MNPVPPPVGFKDRKIGLVVFGILTILMGICWAGFSLLMVVGQKMTAEAASPTPGREMFVPILLMYGSLAIILIWLGVGSIKARRWARALLLILSWTNLVIGVVSLGFMAMIAPQILETIRSARSSGQPELPPSAQVAIFVFVGGFLCFLFVLLPLVWVLFYGSGHVKATCEARDPKIRWTDRCPLPVLAIGLWFLFGAVSSLVMSMAHWNVFPFFGMFLSGRLGTVAYVVFAVASGYAAYRLYKLDAQGWWLGLIITCLFSVSSILTYSRHNVTEVYELMGYSAEQLAQIQKFDFTKGKLAVWTSLLYTMPLIVYLLYIKKLLARSVAMTS